jgi:hypothetical protein
MFQYRYLCSDQSFNAQSRVNWVSIEVLNMGVDHRKFLVYCSETGFLVRGNQAAPGECLRISQGTHHILFKETKMAKMILSHNLLVVHCTLEFLFRECVAILVTTLSYLCRVHNRPKSFNYPSKLFNPQYYGSTLLFPKMGFLAFVV